MIVLYLLSFLPARIALSQISLPLQTTDEQGFGGDVVNNHMLAQWLHSAAQLHTSMSPADLVFVDLLYIQCVLDLDAGIVDMHPNEVGYVLGLQLCIKLGTMMSDIDTELLAISQLIRNPVTAVRVAQQAKEVATYILVRRQLQRSAIAWIANSVQHDSLSQAFIQQEELSLQSYPVQHLIKVPYFWHGRGSTFVSRF